MRLCVIGNSHVGAWQLAWRELARQFPGVSIRFFAAPGSTLKALQGSGRTLGTSDAELRGHLRMTGGADTIELDDYDLFCLVAVGFAPVHLVTLYEGWRGESHRGRQGTFSLVSDACFEASARGLIARSGVSGLCGELAGLTRAPIYLVPQPMPAEAVLHSTTARHAGWRLAHNSGDGDALGSQFARLVVAMCPDNVVPLPQPAETLARPLFTLDRYSRASRRLSRPDKLHAEHEFFHMNASFGTVSLTAFLDVVGAAKASEAA